MNNYIHQVTYYETDKMGIAHHSNYIRWAEEARMDFLRQIGFSMEWLETKGFTSPVTAVDCVYRQSTTFGDKLEIYTWVEMYSGVKLTLAYRMINQATGAVAAEAHSSHCFVDSEFRPVALKKYFPEFDALLKRLAQESKEA